MIFATVGTSPDGFDRLVRGVDAIAPALGEPVTAQVGHGEYIPENINWFRFTDKEEIHELYRTASVVVAHAGAGTLSTALSYERPVVILPRREERGEHNDDHQTELATALSDRPGVQVVSETDELNSAIERARSESPDSVSTDRSLVQFLSGYINEVDT
ncbi:glycosyltransferase (plasmid) [Haloarcula sp. NS06]|uniref:glycosyltransferase n=1 Tax=Haloarcula sp. NS06 TaxID=3409688 RepID=UPI003DA728FE